MKPRSFGMVLALAVLANSRMGFAQQGDAAAAEHLFQEALALLAKGDYEHACPRLAESHKLDSGIGTLLYLGDCQEKLGKTATAWATFREAASAARRAGQNEREKIGRERADALESVVSRLVIEIPESMPREGLVVRRDGQEFGSVLWNTAVPIDPGTYTIDARAPGKVPHSISVVIERGGGTKTVSLPPLEDVKIAVPPPPVPEPVKAPPPRPRPPPENKGIGPVGVTGITLGGAGVLLMGASLGIGLAARARYGEADPFCDATYCDREGVAIRKDALGLAGVGTAVFVPGAILTVAGASLFVLSLTNINRRPLEPKNPAYVSFSFGPGNVTVRGSF